MWRGRIIVIGIRSRSECQRVKTPNVPDKERRKSRHKYTDRAWLAKSLDGHPLGFDEKITRPRLRAKDLYVRVWQGVGRRKKNDGRRTMLVGEVNMERHI